MSLADIIWGIAGVLVLSTAALCETDNANKSMAERMLPIRHVPLMEFTTEDYEKNVLFYLYTKSRVITSQNIDVNDVSSLAHSGFDKRKKTLLVIHGYENNIESAIFSDIKNAALEFHDVNVIGVDWNYYTKNINYAWVVSNTKGVGTFIGQFVGSLIKHGLSEKDLHLIGHSLGAHVAGFAGKELIRHGHKVARITGLDPAFPGFYNTEDSDSRLAATDAAYVDCIHTCSGMLGIPEPICQADFYPNKGQNVQPGCSFVDFGICSHGRSFEYFAESFNPTHLFTAESCEGLAYWIPHKCQDKGAVMGYPATGRYQGIFSLRTNRRSPFAKTIIDDDS